MVHHMEDDPYLRLHPDRIKDDDSERTGEHDVVNAAGVEHYLEDETNEHPDHPVHPKGAPPIKPSIWGWLGRRGLQLVGLAAVVALVVGIAYWTMPFWDRSAPAEITLSTQLTVDTPVGTPGHGDIVEYNGANMVMPMAHFQSGNVLSDSQTLTVATQALGHVENLRRWQLCADELVAQRSTMMGTDQAALKYGGKMPAAITKLRKANEDALRDAAIQAARSHIACTTGKDWKSPHWLAFKVSGNGVTQQAVLSMYDVANVTVESLLGSGNCAAKIQQQYDALRAKPLSGSGAAEQATELATLKANLQLATSDKRTATCTA